VRIVEATAAALGESVDATGALVSENARQLFPAFRRSSSTPEPSADGARTR